MKKGFSLMELMLTIVVLGVLTAIAIPSFSKMRQKADEKQAVVYLRAIRAGQQMYVSKTNAFGCNPSCANAAAIKNELGTEITSGAYTFDVATTSATTFTATATGTHTITIDQDGAFTKDGSAYTPS